MILLTSSCALKLVMEGEETGVQDHWYLVDTHGQKFRLPKTMLFLGREECDVVVASQSVDKRHAVLTFDLYLNRFKVKDLSTTNGTFVNNTRIPEQEYVTLNHMDSVRLGHDAMMYHIEQGSQITNQGGHLPDPHFIPSWAARHPHDPATTAAMHMHHAHAMAECQGCIAEQNIEHSCGLQPDSKPNEGDVRIVDPAHHMYLQQQHRHQQHHHPQYRDQQQCQQQYRDQQQHQQQQYQQYRDQQPCPQHQCREQLQQQQQPYLQQSSQKTISCPVHSDQQQSHQTAQIPSQDPDGDRSASQPQQQLQHNTLQKIMSSESGQEQDTNQEAEEDKSEASPDDLSETPGLGRNTWPRKRIRQVAHVGSIFNQDTTESPPSEVKSCEARPAGGVSSMYFVSFDDSVCNGSNSGGAGAADTQRKPRSTRNSVPQELATVKKGTPLYGQPAWWGEDDDEEAENTSKSPAKPEGDKSEASKSSRPSSLVVSGAEATATSSSKPSAHRPAPMEGERVKPHPSSTYMEIPLRDDDTPEGADKSKDNGTPAKSISSSLSKDSLSVSPEQNQQTKSAKDLSPSTEVNPAMSFTIDLDDPEHPPKKPLNIGSSLSEFMPSKIRKNFRERKVMSSKTSSTESTPSKNSEERELSPGHQRKIDELWSNVEGKVKQPPRLSSIHATAGSSLRSPNLEDIDRLSELSEERRSMERDSDKKGKRPVSSKSPQTCKSAKVTKLSSSTTSSSKVPSAAQAQPAASVNLSQYSDPTSYLIDKMFEGGTSASSSSEREVSPEHKMYREAAIHDKAPPTRRSMDKIPVKSSTKPSVTATATVSTARQPSHGAIVKNGHKGPTSKEPSKPLKCDKKDDDNDDDDLQITEEVPESKHDDKEDKASEAGTYTIEADAKEGQEEEEEARKRIDQVFGVDVEDFTCDRPLIDPHRLASPGGYDNVYDDDADNTYNDGDKTPLDENGHFPPDDDDLTLDDDFGDNDDEEGVEDLPTDMAATDGVQTWVSQLTALTSQKSQGTAGKEEGDTSLSKKPPQGLSRKRPGTGRKLPSIPTDRSPVSSEHSSYVGDQDLNDTSGDGSSDLVVNGKNDANTNGKSVRISSQIHSKGSSVKNGLPSSVSQGGTSSASPATSARSRGSVDTQLLLQDTETVMAAMEARMAYKTSHDKKDSNSVDSDTDVSSTVALANGDEDYVKPTLYNSPRDALAKRHSRELATKSSYNASTSSAPPTSPGKKTVGRSYSQTVASKARSISSPRSTTSTSAVRRSVVSDVFSRADSIDNDSIVSDVSSDAGDGTFSRSSSKGKGTITMTKPNRAFQLRRARADSADEVVSPRSAKSGTSAKSAASSASTRSSSVHSNTRTRSAVDTNRSEATSLGAQIVRKSRTNEAQDKTQKAAANSAMMRADGGRHSLRLQRAGSLTIAQPNTSAASSSKKEPAQKPHLRSTPTGISSIRSNLAVTGVGSNISSRSQSQPGSRNNSPKAAERMAWKRRKEYDPRKAVADAKAKAKDTTPSTTSGVTMRPKPSSRSSINRRMIRSASFTNSVDLSLSTNDSVSTSQEFKHTDRRDSHEHEGFRRAFIPFHSSLRSDRSAHSADEDDSLVSANSAQDSARSMVSLDVNSEPKSAFTPPLLRNKPLSPYTSPPSQAALSLRRRTIHGDGELTSAAPPLTNGDLRSSGQLISESPAQVGNSHSHTPDTASYDSLIVSSIYQLSLKLKTSTDKTLNKLRDQNRVSHTPSPIDDFLSDSGKSEITAWRTANQELAGVLKNLRKIERHVQMMNTVLFPEDDINTEVSSGIRPGRQVKQKYFQEIERIRSELAGFHPIDHPRPDESDIASPEMAELGEQF